MQAAGMPAPMNARTSVVAVVGAGRRAALPVTASQAVDERPTIGSSSSTLVPSFANPE